METERSDCNYGFITSVKHTQEINPDGTLVTYTEYWIFNVEQKAYQIWDDANGRKFPLECFDYVAYGYDETNNSFIWRAPMPALLHATIHEILSAMEKKSNDNG